MTNKAQAEGEKWLEGRTAFPVYYEDTDFSGYVYHANYLKFFERGREELIGRRYLQELFKRGLHYVVARMQISYHAPGKHGDVIEVSTRMKLSEAPVTVFEHVALKEDDKTKLVTASLKVVAVDAAGQATRVPSDVLAYFRSLADKSAGEVKAFPA